MVKLVIQRVVVTLRKVYIELRPVGMVGLLHEILPDTKISDTRPTEDMPIAIEIPVNFKKRSGRKYITSPDGADLSHYKKPKFQTNMIQAIIRGHEFSDILDKNPDMTIKQLAAEEKLDHGYIAKTIRMTQLAPDIIEAILKGRQPQAMTLAELMRPFPNCWNTQRVHFGF